MKKTTAQLVRAYFNGKVMTYEDLQRVSKALIARRPRPAKVGKKYGGTQ